MLRHEWRTARPDVERLVKKLLQLAKVNEQFMLGVKGRKEWQWEWQERVTFESIYGFLKSQHLLDTDNDDITLYIIYLTILF